jgi:outer membrane protein
LNFLQTPDITEFRMTYLAQADRSTDTTNRRHRGASALALAALTTLLGVVGCRSDTRPGFDPKTFELSNQQKEASKGLAPSGPVQLPSATDNTLYDDNASRQSLESHFKSDPLLGPIQGAPRVVQIDLRTAIQRTVVNNLDVRVSSFQPGIDEARVTEAEGRFDPTLFANVGLTRDRSANFTNSFGNESNLWSSTAEAGIRQLLSSGGEITLKGTYNFFNSGRVGLSPGAGAFYVSEFSLELNQPLLRDFGNSINAARIEINRNNQQISVLDFRNTLEEQLARVEQVYWQLVQAQKEVEINQELLQRTIDTAVILSLRKNQDVTRVQLAQAQFSISQRRASLVRARSRVTDLSYQLKRLINDPTLPVGGPDLLLPATPAVQDQVIYSPALTITDAVQFRTEIGQQQLRVDSALIALNVAKNNLLPRLDLVARGTWQNVNTDNALSAIGGNLDFADSWQGVGSLQVQFEYPIGNRAARSIEKRAKLQYSQAEVQYQALVNQVVEETARAYNELETTYREISSQRQARYDAAEALRALQVREDNNEPLTPQFVDQKLRQQEQLAQAATAEAQAVSNYNIAIANLERAKGTLLRYNNVVLQEQALPKK